MSRCFPYPPPGYSKNGATYEALIESIKLQKETVKAVKDKSERKKEKREKKERKEKKREEKRKAEEKQAIKKNPDGFQPNSKVEKTDPKTVAESRNELLEKSDLTEEHCQPTTSQKPSYSSDSTQNSNKRKRDDVSIPDGSSGLGKPIKIRLLKKHKPDSETEVLCTNSGRSDTSLAGADGRLNLVSNSRTVGVPVTSGRENNPVHGRLISQSKSSNQSSERLATKSNDLHGLQFGSKQSAPSSSSRLPLTHLKHDTPRSYSNKTEVPVSSRSNKIDAEMLPSARQQPVTGYLKPLMPLNQKGVSTLDINKAKSIAAGKRPISEITVPDNSCPTRYVKRKEDSISEIPKNLLPGSSGKKDDTINVLSKNVVPDNIVSMRIEKKNDVSISEIPVKASLSRHEKKLQKKFSKYEKVIGSWVPPVFEALQLPVVEEDWLSRRGPKASSSSRDDAETSRELAPSSSWQPCARYLVEADVYALPYTVPF